MNSIKRSFSIAAAVLVALASIGSATRVQTALPALVINQVPPGIVNPADVCNGWYPDVCPVPFADRDFQDRLEWVLDELGDAGVTNVSTTFSALKNGCGPNAGPNDCLPYTPTLITFSRGTFDTFTTGARETIRGTEAVRLGALQAFGLGKTSLALRWYPGYEARHPSEGNPIGDPWPEHPYARLGWKMFRSSAADDDAKFPVGSVFQLDQRKWRKHRVQVSPGAGPFGAGGKVAMAWEETTLR